MSAGKRNEANSISPDLISKVEEFCTSNYFEEQFEAFARENMKIFRSSVDMKDGEEQPIEFFEVYRKYLDKFEKLIEDFIAKVNLVNIMCKYILFVGRNFYCSCGILVFKKF